MRMTLAALALLASLPLCGQQTTPVAAPEKRAAVARQSQKQLQKLARKRLQKAEKLLKKGQKMLARGHASEAMEPLRAAVVAAPEEPRFAEAYELARQSLTQQLLGEAARAGVKGDRVQQLAKLRLAQEFDPANRYVRERMERLAPPAVVGSQQTSDASSHMGVVRLREPQGARAIHEHTDSRNFLQHVSKLFGVTAFVDPSVRSTAITADVDSLTWPQALDLMTQMTHSFATPLSANQLMFLPDTAEGRRNGERMAMRVYSISQGAGASELNDFANVMRLLFNIKFLSVDAASNAIAVRAPLATLDAIDAFLAQLDEQRPEVVIETRLYELQVTGEADEGPSLPTGFQAFNVLSELRSLVGADEARSILNEISSTGTLSDASLATLATALSTHSSSPFLSSFLVFGGGMTMTGFSVPSLTFSFSRNHAASRLLDNVQLLAEQGKSATLRAGMRYPIINSSYSASSGSLSVNLNDYMSYPPSVSYEDLGLTLKATPSVRADLSTQIDLELQLRALGAEKLNDMPIITSREYKGSISSGDGEPILICGELDESQRAAVTGSILQWLPGMKSSSRTRTRTQMILSLTPHVIRRPPADNAQRPAILVQPAP